MNKRGENKNSVVAEFLFGYFLVGVIRLAGWLIF